MEKRLVCHDCEDEAEELYALGDRELCEKCYLVLTLDDEEYDKAQGLLDHFDDDYVREILRDLAQDRSEAIDELHMVQQTIDRLKLAMEKSGRDPIEEYCLKEEEEE